MGGQLGGVVPDPSEEQMPTAPHLWFRRWLLVSMSSAMSLQSEW